MKFPDSRDHADLRAELMAIVNPKVWIPKLGWFHVCHHCGKRKRTHLGMEFDHLDGRPWVLRRLNQRHRLRMYYREWVNAGGLVGLGVVGSCSPCNKKRGARVRYSNTPHGRQRKRRGRGYTAEITAYYQQQLDREVQLDRAPCL